MELTASQSKLLLEACQYRIQSSTRISFWISNLLLRLSGVTPLDSFDERIELLERFGFIKELKTSAEYNLAIHLLETRGRAKAIPTMVSVYTNCPLQDLALLEELRNPKSEVFRKASASQYFLGLANRLKLASKYEGV